MAILTKNHAQLTAEVTRHIEADSVAQGPYETCFIGCLAHHQDNPQYIEDTYGIPIVLSRILEAIFENLPSQEAVDFFAAFPVAVAKDDKDLTNVPWKFLVEVLKKLPQQPQVIDPVIAGLSLLAEGKEWDMDAARAAAEAARAAAEAARAALTVTRAAYWAAAARAALAAAEAGVSFEWQQDLILRLIKEA